MKVTFLGFAISASSFESLQSQDANMLVPTQSFGWAVARALRDAGATVSLISAAPATNYPHNSTLFFRSRRFRDGDIAGAQIPFVNYVGLKHATRFVSALVALFKPGHKRPDAVLVHGVHSAFLVAARIHQACTGVPAFALLTDPPSLRTAFDTRLSWTLKRVDRLFITTLLKGYKGVIVLAPALAELAPGVPSLHMEGIAPQTKGRERGTEETDRVLFAGGIRTENGVLALLDAANLPGRTWSLRIFGGGPQADEVAERSKGMEGVEFLGLIPQCDLASEYRRAAVLMNPRPTSPDFVRYSFPSKVMEYMASGTPLISTRLPTIPAAYEDFVLWCDESPRQIRAAIDAAISMGAEERHALGSRARRFISSERGAGAQGSRMLRFLTIR